MLKVVLNCHCVSVHVWMHIKAVHDDEQLCIEFVSNETKNLTSKNNLLLKECHWIPKRQKYFTMHEQLSHENIQYPMMSLSQTMVVRCCHPVLYLTVCLPYMEWLPLSTNIFVVKFSLSVHQLYRHLYYEFSGNQTVKSSTQWNRIIYTVHGACDIVTVQCYNTLIW